MRICDGIYGGVLVRLSVIIGRFFGGGGRRVGVSLWVFGVIRWW